MRFSWVVGVVCVVLVSSFAGAGVIGTPFCQADGDGAVVCQPSSWNPNTNTLSVVEDMYRSPAHVEGQVQADGDPTVLIAKYVNNATGGTTNETWSAYHFNIFMDQPFTIDSAMVPAGWTRTITPASTGTFHDMDGRSWGAWGAVDFFASSPTYYLAPGGMDLFGANVTFGSTVNFEVEQIGIVPEPATLALLVLGGLFVRRYRK